MLLSIGCSSNLAFHVLLSNMWWLALSILFLRYHRLVGVKIDKPTFDRRVVVPRVVDIRL